MTHINAPMCGEGSSLPAVRDDLGTDLEISSNDALLRELSRVLNSSENWVGLWMLRFCAVGQLLENILCASTGDERSGQFIERAEILLRVVRHCLVDSELIEQESLRSRRSVFNIPLIPDRVVGIISGAEPAHTNVMRSSTQTCNPLSDCFPQYATWVSQSCVHCCEPVNTCGIDLWKCCGMIQPPKRPKVRVLKTSSIERTYRLKRKRSKREGGRMERQTNHLVSETVDINHVRQEISDWLNDPTSSRSKVWITSDIWLTKDVCFDGSDVAQPTWWLPDEIHQEHLDIIKSLSGVCGDGVDDGDDSWVFDSYGSTVFLGDSRERPDDVIRGLTMLSGQLMSNIWHFTQDALWLYKMKHIFHNVNVLRTKYADSVCMTDGTKCWLNRESSKHFEADWQDMLESAIYDKSFRFSRSADLHRPVCFEVVAQPWRHLPGGSYLYRDVRKDVIKHCRLASLEVAGPSLVVIERGSKYRGWHEDTMKDMEELLPEWADKHGFEVRIVRLGDLNPCEQVAAVLNATFLIGIGGADLANALWLPEHAALIEVEAGCVLNSIALDERVDMTTRRKARKRLCRSSQSIIKNQHCLPEDDPFNWRDPNMRLHGILSEWASLNFHQSVSNHTCSLPESQDPVIGFSSSQGYRKEFAQGKGISYRSIVQCECEDHGDSDCFHPFKQGKIKIDIKHGLIPLLDDVILNDFNQYVVD